MDYKQWFDQFQAQIGKEDPRDPTSTFINLNRPEDRGRIFAMGDTAMENILPADGPITDAHKQQLFNLANDGKLFVFSLGSTDPIQADVKEGNLLRDLQFHPSDRG